MPADEYSISLLQTSTSRIILFRGGRGRNCSVRLIWLKWRNCAFRYPAEKRLWYFAPLYVRYKSFANDLAYDKLVISDPKDGQFIGYPGQLNLWHCRWLSEWRFDFTMTTMTTRISTNQGFLCTMHSLQCNCARDLFGHPRGWNLWFLKLSLPLHTFGYAEAS